MATTPLDLRQLEAFVQVANQHSFSRAAESLGLTQPSVTARIQSLERELGESLFQRNGRGVTLTEAGASFLPYAKRVLKSLQEGYESVQAVRRLDLGTLRLGAAPTVSTYVLPELLKAFRSQYPGLDVAVRTEYSDRIVELVLSDEVELGMERTISHPDLVTTPLYRDEVALVTSPEHRFAGRAAVSVDELSGEPLIMFNRGSSYYALVHGALRQAGVPVETAMELDNMEATKKMVEKGLGIAMLPRVALERELASGELREIRVEGLEMPQREISLIYRKNRPLSRAGQAFVGLLAERYGVDAG
jgi:DNA-binding transcriptional LysR family regulator